MLAICLVVQEDGRAVDAEDEVRAALGDYRAGRVEPVAGLIARINRVHGCEATATFDRRAARLDGFVAVG